MRGDRSERSLLPCSLKGFSGKGCDRGSRNRGLYCIALCLLAYITLASCQSDPYGAVDMGVHRVSLYRTAGPEDKDKARRERNVLVSLALSPNNSNLTG